MHDRDWARTGSARALALAVALVVLGAGGSAPAAAASPPSFRPGVVLVGFQPGVPAARRRAIARAAGAVGSRRVGAGVRLRVGRASVLAAVRSLRRRREVRYAEPDYLMRAAAVPGDPAFPLQWGPADDGATAAWDVSTGSRSIVIAEVDSGVDYNHPDLAANIWSNPGGVGGCPAGTHGFNVLTAACDPMDDDAAFSGHGTHVAGILGAAGDNEIGVAGMNWSTTILPVKWLNASGSGSTGDLIAALDWVVRARQAGVDIRVVNDSATFVGTAFSQALSDEIDVLGDNGILFVTAAGNTADDNDDPRLRRYPCGYDRPTEICVTASDRDDRLPSWANYGAATVDLAAPGDHVYSTLRDGSYGFISGGSMAAPQVAGAAALVLSRADLSVTELKSALLDSVDPVPALAGLVRTGGRLNVCRALPGCVAAPRPAPASTLGTTTIGAATDSFGADRKRVNRATLAEPGTLTQLRLFLEPGGASGQASVRGVVYADADGAPGALLGASAELVYHATDARGWYDLPLASPLPLAAGRYWLGVLTGGADHVAGFRWQSVADSRVGNANGYADGPSDPFGAVGSTDDERMSLYGVYEPRAAAGEPTPPAAGDQEPAAAGDPPPTAAGDGSGPPAATGAACGSPAVAACDGPSTETGAPDCPETSPLAGAAAHGAGRGLAFSLAAGSGPVDVEVLTVDGGGSLARFHARRTSFAWRGPRRALRDGIYVVRFASGGDERRVAVERRGGSFHARPAYGLRAACGAVRLFELDGPVFGGRHARALGISYRLATTARAEVRVVRGARMLRRFAARAVPAGRLVAVRLASTLIPPGDVRVVLRVTAAGRTLTRTLTARRL
ncbi:MAG TPA: S8 family peptidase [Solirubrobacteraceae bacterium]